jgi:hypothetical protein
MAKKKLPNKLFHIENHINDLLQADGTDQTHIQTEEFGKGFADENKTYHTYIHTQENFADTDKTDHTQIEKIVIWTTDLPTADGSKAQSSSLSSAILQFDRAPRPIIQPKKLVTVQRTGIYLNFKKYL